MQEGQGGGETSSKHTGMRALVLSARAFTLIEILVALTLLGLLIMLALPRYFGHTERAKEAVLKENLATLREAIDKYYGNSGRYPASLQDLVDKRYLRQIPLDPWPTALRHG